MTKPKTFSIPTTWVLHPVGVWVDANSGFIFNRLGRRLGCRHGHAYLRISRGGKLYYAHRLVFEAVHGCIPYGLQINHINGDKHDNRSSNLEAVSQAENLQHAAREGLAAWGERSPLAKLTERQVQDALATAGAETATACAKRLGVSRSAISMIRSRKNWKQLGVDAGCLQELRR